MSRDTATDTQPDVVRVQEELLNMLRMAGNEAPPPRREVVAAPPPRAESQAPKVRTCAKCGSEKPWGKSNWCPDCGYYPKAGFAGTGVAENEDDKPPPRLIDILPVWAIPMAIGMGTILITSIASRFIFYDALTRSFVAIAQFLAFGMAAFVVHCRSSYIAVNAGRSWMALVNPTETWMMIANMMPQKKWLIVVAGVGLTGVASSFLIGPDPEMIVKQIQKENKGKKMTLASLMKCFQKVTGKAFGKEFAGKQFALRTVGKLVSATSQASSGPESANFEDALGSLAGKADLFTGGSDTQAITQAAEAPPETSESEDDSESSEGDEDKGEPEAPVAVATPVPVKGSPSKPNGSVDGKLLPNGEGGINGQAAKDRSASLADKETLDCLVYGYTANAEGEVRALLLATKSKTGALRFYQKLALDSLGKEELGKLNEDLKSFRTRSSAIKSPYTGKWVKPVVVCRVAHDGLDSDDRPTNPQFHSLVLP